MMEPDEERELHEDPRLKALGKVGGFWLGLLAICALMATNLADYSSLMVGLLVLAAIAGMCISMVAIWISPARKANSREIAEMQREIAELSARLANLEMIDSFERRLAQREAQAQLQQAPPSPPTNTASTPDVMPPTQPRIERQG
ncbi:MAG: hypothetical protein ACYC6A_08615 [Armatimonadota bacterium]